MSKKKFALNQLQEELIRVGKFKVKDPDTGKERDILVTERAVQSELNRKVRRKNNK